MGETSDRSETSDEKTGDTSKEEEFDKSKIENIKIRLGIDAKELFSIKS